MNDIHLKKINPLFGTIRIEGTEKAPLFCASDVCKALGYAKPQNAVAMHVDEGDALKQGIGVVTGKKADGTDAIQTVEMTFVNESGLYALIFGSKLPQAKEFKRWVTSEILPSIRQDGGYMVTRDDETEEDLMARALLVAQATLKRREERIKQLEAKAMIDAPKVEFFDSVAESKDAIEMKAVANTLNYVSIGRNKLFAILREQKVLLPNNLPYQKYIDAGYFRTIETKKNCGSEIRIFIKTLVYQKGLDYIRKMLDRLGYKPKETKE